MTGYKVKAAPCTPMTDQEIARQCRFLADAARAVELFGEDALEEYAADRGADRRGICETTEAT